MKLYALMLSQESLFVTASKKKIQFQLTSLLTEKMQTQRSFVKMFWKGESKSMN